MTNPRTRNRHIYKHTVGWCGICDRDALVIDKRVSARLKTITRRRQCQGCGSRWTTVEIGKNEYKELQRAMDLVIELSYLGHNVEE